ncbi:MAG: C25 family cysteine peptidase [Candidatus Muiribacteriota bacterium]
MKKLILMTAVLSFAACTYSADWVPFNQTRGSRGTTQQVSQQLVADMGNTLTFDVTIPGMWIEKEIIDGKEYSKINLDGSSVTLKKGYPELRKVTAFLAMPYSNNAVVEIVNKDFFEIENVMIVPSKGNVPRSIKLSEVPYTFDSNVYNKNIFWPADDELISNPEKFIMRDLSGIRIEVIPFQYNDSKKTLRVVKNFTVRVSVPASRSGFNSPRVNYTQSQEFENLYSDLFMNYRPVAPQFTRSGGSNLTAPAQVKHLLIIAHDDFYNATEPLAIWKRKKGYEVDFKKLSEIGTSAYEIQSYIDTKYQQGELCFVTFVGDKQHIPTKVGLFEGADSDTAYVKLAGNDNVPDAFISRISVSNEQECKNVVAKTIKYEKEPQQNASWYKKALAIASSEGQPTDIERTELLNMALSSRLGFTDIAQCYEPVYYGFGANSNFSDDKSIITNAVNNGVSIINYMGHGSPFSWVTSGFNISDVNNISNKDAMPVIWSVACVNGAIAEDVCFAEAWLRKGDEKGGGAIGIAASTTDMSWVPPVLWQHEIIVEQLAARKHDKGAVLNLYGMLKTMKEFGTGNITEGNQLVEQVIYFGEGSVSIRTDAPKPARAEAVIVDGRIVVSVNSDVKAGISVTAYDDNNERFATALTDNNGYAELPYEGQTKVTVWHKNIVPQVDVEIR